MDLTVDEAPSPKTSTANTGVNIYNILSAKRRKRGADTRSKLSLSGKKSELDTTGEVEHTEENSNGKGKEAPDFEVLHPSDDITRDNRAVTVDNGNSSVNDNTLQEVDSMETSDSQRPKLSRFRRFTRRTANGFISARVTTAVSWWWDYHMY